jgi:hypothetical protein
MMNVILSSDVYSPQDQVWLYDLLNHKTDKSDKVQILHLVQDSETAFKLVIFWILNRFFPDSYY